MLKRVAHMYEKNAQYYNKSNHFHKIICLEGFMLDCRNILGLLFYHRAVKKHKKDAHFRIDYKIKVYSFTSMHVCNYITLMVCNQFYDIDWKFSTVQLACLALFQTHL